MTLTPQKQASIWCAALAVALLSTSAPQAAASKPLRASVTPRVANLAERTCFRFTVRTSQGKPLNRARVHFMGKTHRTNRRGKVRVCTKLVSQGRHKARISKRGHRGRYLNVGVTDATLRSEGPGWHYFETHINTYAAWGGFCDGGFFGEARDGRCRGPFSPNSTTVKPFSVTNANPSDGRAYVRHTEGNPISFLIASYTTQRDSPNGYLAGWVPSANAPALVITDGWVPSWGATDISTPGLDPNLLGKPGGALYIDVESHPDYDGHNGYSFDIWGYLWY
jgi:hypothetical protein